MRRVLSFLILIGLSANSYAQLSKNPNKFLGNITTSNQIRNDFLQYWNQLTPENETKWGSIEGTRGKFNWTAVDREYKFCKDNNIPFKFHTLVWGSQYPKWMDDLTKEEQLEEITIWFDTLASRYPDLDYIDVVNEAITGHEPAPFKDALGGDGVSGYDWIVKSFQMARERWPNAVLIYNDYNTFKWQINQFIDLLQKIKAAGAPIDAAGCQAHDLNDMSGADFKKALERIHNETSLPIYITEYDISKENDEEQLKRYKEQFPIMWEADYVAGVTLWGYIYGKTWSQAKYSGLIKNGVERPALEWLREYMLTDDAIDAKAPTNASNYAILYASPAKIEVGSTSTIKAKAKSDSCKITEMQLYLNDTLLTTADTSAFSYQWESTIASDNLFTMKVFGSVSNTTTLLFEKNCTITVYEPEIIEEPIEDTTNTGSTAIIDEIADDINGAYMVYSIMGIYQGTYEINNGDTSILNGKMPKGIYVIRKKENGKARRIVVY